MAFTLLICGSLILMSVQAVLLRNLDMTLLHRAAALHHITDAQGRTYTHEVTPPAEDRSILQNERHQTLARHPSQEDRLMPELLSARFVSLPDGSRMRTLQFKAFVKAADGGAMEPVVATYSGSAREYGAMMRSVLVAIVVCIVIGGTAATLVARRLAHRALRPLRDTADAVASIDFASLDRRLSTERLPEELRTMADTFNGMLKRIENGARQQKRFLDDAAHELRTPVASLLLSAELACEGNAAQRPSQLKPILSQARLLKRLVDSLMSAARADTVVPEQAEPIDLSRLLQSVVDMMAPLAARRGSSVALKTSREGIVEVPPLLMRKVVTNLVSNAIEHNPPGTRVSIRLEMENDLAVVTVEDNGQGIEAQHHAKLAVPGYRTDPQCDSTEHLGLGLALVESALSQMGGTLTLRSQPGTGSSFEIRLPGVRWEPPPEDTPMDLASPGRRAS